MKLTTDIIPLKQTFIGSNEDLDFEAICVFVALGFFLDRDTYYKKQKVLRPASHYEIDDQRQNIISETPFFKWHYTPKERSLAEVTEEFGVLLESIIKSQIGKKKVILPLSGGLDSRTQAVALHRLDASVKSYSYSFKGGHDESWYGKQIAKECDFSFQAMKVPDGYLWNEIEKLAKINGCYSEFTHPRQMAFIEDYEAMGDVFSLGHWGDVLFDDMNVDDTLSNDQQIEIILKKIIKKKGLELAVKLWDEWGLNGDFLTYLKGRIHNLLLEINISESANAQIRAFKSLCWAPRWTSVNLSIFESVRPITLPYYDHRMCEFICSVPERHLSRRQIQIAYIMERFPKLAKLRWEAQRPFNLYNYHLNKSPWNIPYRIINKMNRSLQTSNYIQRNWELQFIGKDNEKQLEQWIFDNPDFNNFIPMSIRKEFYLAFKEKDAIHNAHAISMLLTLSVFSKLEKIKIS